MLAQTEEVLRRLGVLASDDANECVQAWIPARSTLLSLAQAP